MKNSREKIKKKEKIKEAISDWKKYVNENKIKCPNCNYLLIGLSVPLYEQEKMCIVWHLGLYCKKCSKSFIPRKFAKEEFKRREI